MINKTVLRLFFLIICYEQSNFLGGYFIEAGAYDFEYESTSLYFELLHDWTVVFISISIPSNLSIRKYNFPCFVNIYSSS